MQPLVPNLQPDGPARQIPGPQSVASSSETSERPPSSERREARNPGRRSRKGLWGLLATAVAATAMTIVALTPASTQESQSRNWEHVLAANQSAENGQPMQWRTRGGSLLAVSEISLGKADRDVETTSQVKAALIQGDLALADRLAFSTSTPVPAPTEGTAPPQPQSQSVPPDAPVQEIPAPAPSLSPGMRTEIQNGDTEFFHIYLYDSCCQDGDVVEILLNGESAFLVPITNSGSTLSVPVSRTSVTTIAVRGIFDGGGGITVACRTSEGDGFVRVMEEGELQTLGVVVK